MNKSIVNNVWTNVSLEQLHQRIAYTNAVLLATDDILLSPHVLQHKREIQTALDNIWNEIHPIELETISHTIAELIDICSLDGFRKLCLDHNINEDSLITTKVVLIPKELESYK